MTVGAGLSREERETIVNGCDADDCWDIYTSSPTMARRLAKLAESWGVTPTYPDKWGMRVILPRKALGWRKNRGSGAVESTLETASPRPANQTGADLQTG